VFISEQYLKTGADLFSKKIMKIKELIETIATRHAGEGVVINKPASPDDIASLEKFIGDQLPEDFKELYMTCNGFDSDNDFLFSIIPIAEIIQNKLKDVYGKVAFAQYLIYSDTWSWERISANEYAIINNGEDVIITHSLTGFLEHFIEGGLFEKNGLYDLQAKSANGK
jgi:hypothetical protein